MDHPLIDLINAKIAEAEKDGAFENLPGAGKPLPRLEDPENALLNRVIAENGAEPEFVTLSRQLRQLRAELAEESDRTRRREIMKDMSMMEARIDLARRAYSR
ncbi:DnaJ family domain-containing protein [Pseudooceanicola nitratireducens]|uniref:DnaJ family domain-containing protein n=1 Tax=Pseudooceanicola nitratireducens TaxID=517719 RepID=UPI001C93B312|nr:DUF1992 domain-containing protein [Pseudooceanicola nitratireducens]MBY6158516.1 DUF1992 domain-containing protein [Pseudooceanicola nitratireducens]